VKAKLKQIWLDFISLIFPRYTLTVSYNDTWGDKDDQSFVVKKFYVKKEKHLKFRDENNRLIEYRSASGLNYIIEDI